MDTASFNISIKNDNVFEYDEKFSVSIISRFLPCCCTYNSANNVEIVIENDVDDCKYVAT